MSRPKKKIVLFLVEGNTDINVLSGPIQSLFEKYSSPESPFIVEFCTYRESKSNGGDITSSIGVTPDNIEGIISKNFIEPFMQKNQHYYLKDICEIVQVVDIDGVFVPDENIVQNDDIDSRPVYTSSQILAKDRQSIIERNERKRANLNRLVNMDKICISKNGGKNTKTINYSVYYFSCNMDHCIHGEANCSTPEKVKNSDAFMRKYDTEDAFCNYLESLSVCCDDMNYQESWDYIMKEGISSLERRTNLNVLINRIKNA